MWELDYKESWVSGESPWTKSLASYSPWGHKELDTTEWLTLFLSLLWLTVFQQMCQSNPTEKIEIFKNKWCWGNCISVWKKNIYVNSHTSYSMQKLILDGSNWAPVFSPRPATSVSFLISLNQLHSSNSWGRKSWMQPCLLRLFLHPHCQHVLLVLLSKHHDLLPWVIPVNS